MQNPALTNCSGIGASFSRAKLKNCISDSAHTASGFTEWSESPDILSRQIEMLRQDGISDGFVIYSSTTFYKEDELSLAVRESVENTIGNVAGE